MRRPTAIGVVLLACAVAAPTAAALPLLSHHGRWLTDPQGRVVILHGVQIDKFKLGTAIDGWIDVPPVGVRFIGAEGFNVARVSVNYAAAEPQLGHFDDSYLRQFIQFDRLLARAETYDLVDMMQGQYSYPVGGSGFPDWMTITNGVPNIPRPFPEGYLVNPAEERAWDNLWSNAPASDGVGLQDHYARGLQHLASAFDGQPAFLGFDLLNEPWPGTPWPTCANPLGCPVFDQELKAFYRRIIPAVRAIDRQHLVFYEPHALFDEGAASNIGSVGDPGGVFTFHNYCLGDQPGLPQADPFQNCGIEEELVLADAEAQAARGNDGLLEDEWGNTASIPLLERMTAEADQHMIGWSYWAYEDCCLSPGAIVYNGASAPTAPGNLNLPVLKALVRPYPKVVAGTPLSWSYDPASDRFTLTYSTRPVGGGSFPAGAGSEVELPALHYPTGYSVRVSGAHVLSPPDVNLLRLANERGAGTVTLTITPASHHPGSPGPFTWPAGVKLIAPADCAASSSQVVRVRGGGIAQVAVYIDGALVSVHQGHRIRRVRLPSGLADGSIVDLATTDARGGRSTITGIVSHCRFRPSPFV